MNKESSLAVSPKIDQVKWEAVQSCDMELDGQFVYAVLTTGVYCRPSCKSKKPNRENISFYDSPNEAERHGYRPCKRCVPDRIGQVDRKLRNIERACRILETSDETISLDKLAKTVGMSRFHFQRVFKKITGITPKSYAETCRSGRIRKALADGATVTGAIFDSGYGSTSRFYEKSDQILGMKPSQYRSGGKETKIWFAVGKCSLGAILVATTELGICAIDLGDVADRLVLDFQDRFPNAELVGGDSKFEKLVATVVGWIDEPGNEFELPLDVNGTSFQCRVWETLRQIPIGSTVTYSQLAKMIGRPKSTRAVANACANNKIAVAIPCHRVIRTDGSLSGYRWGISRKEAILNLEASTLKLHSSGD